MPGHPTSHRQTEIRAAALLGALLIKPFTEPLQRSLSPLISAIQAFLQSATCSVGRAHSREQIGAIVIIAEMGEDQPETILRVWQQVLLALPLIERDLQRALPVFQANCEIGSITQDIVGIRTLGEFVVIAV